MLVLYIILFIASIFFYILYVGSFSFYLFAFLLVMPIILFVMLKKMSKKISVGFVNTQKTAGRSSKIPVVLRLQNRSKLPVANMIIEIEYYNTLDGDKNTMKINTPLYPDDVQYLTLHVSAKHYGTVRMNIKRCRIVDMLKLFKVKVYLSKTTLQIMLKWVLKPMIIPRPQRAMIPQKFLIYTNIMMVTK